METVIWQAFHSVLNAMWKNFKYKCFCFSSGFWEVSGSSEKNRAFELARVVHASDLTTQEADIGGSWIQS